MTKKWLSNWTFINKTWSAICTNNCPYKMLDQFVSVLLKTMSLWQDFNVEVNVEVNVKNHSIKFYATWSLSAATCSIYRLVINVKGYHWVRRKDENCYITVGLPYPADLNVYSEMECYLCKNLFFLFIRYSITDEVYHCLCRERCLVIF